SVLAVRGLTMIDDGLVTRILPLKEARTAGGGLVDGSQRGSGFATRLLPLRHVDVSDVAAALDPLVSKEGSLVAYRGTNTLIATDTLSNLDRMAEVVASLDIAQHEESVQVIALEYADASTLAEQIELILGSGKSRAKDKSGTALKPSFKIVPDERTNSLIVIGPANERRKVDELARGLDTALSPGDQRINVYYVKYANAMELVDVVSGMLSGRRRVSAPGTGAARAATGRSEGLSDEISITGDPSTNAIIVNASASDYRSILALLEDLDIQRPQVFVEAIVAEVSIDRAEALGVEFQGVVEGANGILLGRSSLGSLGAAFFNPAALSGLLLAAASDKTIETPDGQEIPAQAVIITALANDQDIEVLSAPTLLMLDNQEARIVVGENIPFITGQGIDAANLDNVFTTIERRDVGVKLTITPQVAEGDIVILNIQEEVSAVNDRISAELVTSVGPVYTIRSAETTVSVRDGHTAVIGGLISNSLTTASSKVPYLGDIPYLGRLFRTDAERGEKVNLIVVLTPHIIRNATDMAVVSDRSGRAFRETLSGEGGQSAARSKADSIPGLGSPIINPDIDPTAGILPPRQAADEPF
ncbi:MAG: type II secretion system secretin GspD, partial [Candidatus Binatia bacterium]